MRRILKILAYALASLSLGLILVIAGLHTGAGSAVLAGILNSMLSNDASKVEVTSLQLHWPGRITAERLKISDNQGEWLEIENAKVLWSPSALLAGEVDIEKLTVAAIRIDRKPVSQQTEDSENSASGVSLPLAVRVASAKMQEIALGKEVAGIPVRLRAEASLDLKGLPGPAKASVRIDRDDDIAGHLNADFSYLMESAGLKFGLSASEPAGGLISRLLEIANFPSIDVALHGEGDFDNLDAELAVALDGIEAVAGSASIQPVGGEGRRLLLDLDGEVGRLVPRELRPLLAGKTKAVGQFDFDQDYAFTNAVLDTSTASLKLSANGSYSQGQLDGTLAADLLKPLQLAVSGAEYGASGLSVTASAKGQLDNLTWQTQVSGSDVSTPEGTVAELAFSANGAQARLASADLHIPVSFHFETDVLETSDERLAFLAGKSNASGVLTVQSRSSIEVQSFNFENTTLKAALAGTASPDAAEANGSIIASDLSAFSAIAGQPLGGVAQLEFTANGDPGAKTGTLEISIDAKDLTADVAQLDRLLEGASRFSGSLSVADGNRFSIDEGVLTTPGIALTLDGAGDLDSLEKASATGRIKDLSRIEEAASGELGFKLSASGSFQALDVDAGLTSDKIILNREPLENLNFQAKVRASVLEPQGALKLTASVRNQPVVAKANLSTDPKGMRWLEDIELVSGDTKLTGRAGLDAGNQPQGKVRFASPDLSALEPFIGRKLAGQLEGNAEYQKADGKPVLDVDVSGAGLGLDGIVVGSANLTARATDPLNVPDVTGRLLIKNAQVNETLVPSVSVEASGTGTGAGFTVKAELDDGSLDLTGQVAKTVEGVQIGVEHGQGTYKGASLQLSEPLSVLIGSDGKNQIQTARFKAGGGEVIVAGRVGDDLDVHVDLVSLPASLANSIAPELGLGGTLNGKIDVSGPVSDPVAQWSARWNGVQATALSALGNPKISVDSTGQYQAKAVRHETDIALGQESLLKVSGMASISGALDMAVTGKIAYGLIQPRLTEAGLRLDGAASVNLKVAGTAKAPAISGKIATANASLVSLNTGLVIKELAATANLSSNQVSITSLTGAIGEGRLSGSGKIGLAAPFPADIKIKVVDGVYSDGRIVTARLNADLNVTGSLAQQPKLAGLIVLQRADITIPQTLGTTLTTLDVKHVNAPSAVVRQSAGLNSREREETSGGIGLDLELRAPGQIYVRGRGVQAELGGQIKITGSSSDPASTGAFELRRGTLTFLTRVLTFTKGRIYFVGNFDPLLDFAATTTAQSTAITVSLTGNASDPKVEFSSSPDYPQEEILALLLFNQNLSNLSGVQIAQLASAVASLGGADPLDNLRKALGVDMINLTTDDENNASIELRKKLNERVDVGVQRGSKEGSGRVTVDIDLTNNLRARGEVGADGSSKAGVFFEKEF